MMFHIRIRTSMKRFSWEDLFHANIIMNYNATACGLVRHPLQVRHLRHLLGGDEQRAHARPHRRELGGGDDRLGRLEGGERDGAVHSSAVALSTLALTSARAPKRTTSCADGSKPLPRTRMSVPPPSTPAAGSMLRTDMSP